MEDLRFRPKNFGSLSREIYNTVNQQFSNIKEIAVSDSSSPVTQIIELDMVKLLHGALMGKLSELGVTKLNSESEAYMNGLNINLDSIEVDIQDGRMRIHIQRDHQTNMNFLNTVHESLKSGGPA